MKKIALVNQRYGMEVNGGSEYYTRLIAEKLSEIYEVEILTTCAKDYDTWKNVYLHGEEKINNITVRRFRIVSSRKKLQQKLAAKILFWCKSKNSFINDWWIIAQGPYVPEMIDYIQQNKEQYDVFIFVTYLYYTTVKGMPQVSEKSIFIPTAHDEFCIDFPIYRPLFHIPKAILYLTDEERDIVWRKFCNCSIPSEVAGVGIDLPAHIDERKFRQQYLLKNDFFLYVGRIDENKGCKEMVEYFLALLDDLRDGKEKIPIPHLVMLGQEFMEIESSPYIHVLGFVSDEVKFNALAAAKALWLPSEFESLSISVLEALSSGTPIVVNGKCNVLRAHCEKSNGGEFYFNKLQCITILKKMISNEYEAEYKKACNNSIKYIEEYYSWNHIMNKIVKLIEL